jgi:putative phage-type endonuclease
MRRAMRILYNPADYPDKDAGERAWLAARTKGIGASEIALVLGASPWGSEYAMWSGKVAPDDKPPLRSSRYEWGHRQERSIVEALTEESNFVAQYPGRWTPRPDGRLLQHSKHPIILATPDYSVVGEDGRELFVECKTSTQDEMWRDGVPYHVVLQVQQQMAVLDVSVIIVAWLLHGWDFNWYPVERDNATIATMIAKAETWWATHVVGNVAPAVDGSDDTKAAIHRRFPEATSPDDVVPLPGEFVALDEERVRLGQHIKDEESRIEEINNKIKDAIGVHSKGMLPSGVSYSWPVQQRKAFSVKASATRVLRRSEPKEPKA